MDSITLDGGVDLVCPRCGRSLDGLFEETSVAVGAAKRRIRAPVRCQNTDCSAPLDIVLEGAQADPFDVGVHVEEGHRTLGEDR